MHNIAIVCGGYSGEFEVSVKSGAQVFLHLDKEKYHPYLVEIRRNEWVCRIDGKEIPVD